MTFPRKKNGKFISAKFKNAISNRLNKINEEKGLTIERNVSTMSEHLEWEEPCNVSELSGIDFTPVESTENEKVENDSNIAWDEGRRIVELGV